MLLAELGPLYRDGLASLPTPPALDRWLARAAARERDETAAVAFWREVLTGDVTLRLPADRRRTGAREGAAVRAECRLDRAITNALTAAARQAGATLPMLLLAAFGVFLGRHCGEGDLRIGVPVSRRTDPTMASLVGLFINTIVVRLSVSPWATAAAVLQQARNRLLDAQAHADLPFARLVDALQPVRDPSRTPLFDVMFSFAEDATALDVPAVVATPMPDTAPVAQYDLTFEAVQDADGVSLRLDGAADLFEPATVEALLQSLRAAIDEFGNCVPAAPAILGQVEGSRPVVTAEAHFSAAARATPSAGALVCHDGAALDRVDYATLDRMVGQVAEKLRLAGVAPGQPVALLVSRTPWMVAALLGIIRAGAAYVPLDPTHPADRLRFILDDADIRLVVADAVGAGALLDPGRIVLRTDEIAAADRVLSDGRPPHRRAPAYIIYTSGTTGRPKGVVVSHEALARHLDGFIETYGISAGSTMLHGSTVAFDVAAHEILPALMMGGRVVMRGIEAWSFEALSQLLEAEGVTFARLSTAFWRRWSASGATCPPALRQLTVGGEALAVDALAVWRAGPFAALPLDNLYGPTETTIACFRHVTGGADLRAGTGAVAIGRPMPARHAVVLDRSGLALPMASVGELAIGGVTVADGYLGRPGLTAERFVPDPYGLPGSRLYRSGDLVRLGADGAVGFLGRIDDQIKLRGYRIEPGEIEASLRAQPGVTDAAVILRDGRLLAFMTGAGDPAVVRDGLARTLPGHMVPSVVVVLASLPLTSNGKLDRRALPQVADGMDGLAGVEARTPAEAALLGVARTLLRRPGLGITDNFFEAGGDSILSLQLVARARRAGLGLLPRQVFEHPRLADLAAAAEAVQDGPLPPVTGPLPPSPIQARFLGRHAVVPSWWNQAVLLRVPSALAVAGPSHVRAALVRLQERHEALRLRASRSDAGAWQVEPVPAEGGVLLLEQEVGADAGALSEACTAVQRSLDVGSGRLLRAGWFVRPDGSVRLLLAVHHLGVDVVSWGVLLGELRLLWSDAAAVLDPVAVPWSAWAVRLAALAPGSDAASWWSGALAGAVVPALGEAPGAARRRDASREAEVRLGAAATASLLRDAPRALRMRPDEVLLATLAAALASEGGGAFVDLEGHGRDVPVPGVEPSRTVGWFTTRHPVWLPALAASEAGGVVEGIGMQLVDSKERLRAAARRGWEWGQLQVRGAVPSGPQPEISVNYLGRLDAALGDDTTSAALGDDALGDDTTSAALGLAPEGPGETVDPAAPGTHALDINAAVEADGLRVSLRYAPALFGPARAEALLRRLRAGLEAAVAHLAARAPGVTASDFPLSGLSGGELSGLGLAWGEVLDLYPATSLQSGLVFHSLLGGGGTYVTQLRLRLGGAVDAAALRGAWEDAVRRHDVLRTGFAWRHGGAVMQVVHRTAALDWRELSLDDAAAVAAWCAADAAAGFDLARAPLLRLALIRRGDGGTELVRTVHHAITDGWSAAVLLGEVAALYAARMGGPPAVLAPPVPYRRHVAWLAAQPPAEGFWREQLAGLDEASQLATAIAPPSSPSSGPDQGDHDAPDLDVVVPAEAADRLRAWAGGRGITLATAVAGAWAVVLSRLTRSRRVVFGTTVSGRPADLPDAERMLGLFINSLPVCVLVPGAARLEAWLGGLQRQLGAVSAHAGTALPQIGAWTGRSGDALFDSLLVVENYPVDPGLGTEGPLRIEAAAAEERTHYPLTLTVLPGEAGEPIRLAWARDPARLGAPEVAQLASLYTATLTRLCAGDDPRLSDLALPTDATLSVPPPAATPQSAAAFEPVAARVARWARQQPGAEAVSCDGVRLTYAELDALADRLAAWLAAHGAAAETRVGLALSRSALLPAALLGTLRAGCAYVPLDPAYPQPRLDHMIQDAGITLHVTDALMTELQHPTNLPNPPAPPPIHPDQAAYVIYTSGSTGIPKGVVVTHANVAAHFDDFVGTYRIGAADVMLHSSTVNFDVALHEMLPALTVGGRVAMRGNDAWDLATLKRVLAAEGVTFARLPTAYWQQWLHDLPAELPRLRQVTVGGEALAGDALARWQAGPLGHLPLDNLYGPTETTIAALRHTTAPADAAAATVAIGRPLPSRRIAVLDLHGHPAPAGVLGELGIGGTTGARGYLHRPGLTAERFVPDPHGPPGSRMYRSGDLVRQRSDGVVDFLGRTDNQIKLRGFRIEPGEIEAALRRIPGVRDAVVLLGGKSDAARLVGHVAGTAMPKPDALRAILAQTLPAHMVPAALHRHDTLPRLPNGKLDTATLAWQTNDEPTKPQTATPAQNEAEATLLDITRTVLKTSNLTLEQNFFEAGGDSLGALRVVSLAQAAGLPQITLQALFDPGPLRAVAGGQDSVTPDVLLALNRSTGAPALVCIHPGDGFVGGYRPLAAALAGTTPVMGLQCPLLTDPAWRPIDLQGLAADYAGRIVQAVPQGPLALLGWSLGGAVAVATARQLCALGREVTLLALVDALPPTLLSALPPVFAQASLPPVGALLRELPGEDETERLPVPLALWWAADEPEPIRRAAADHWMRVAGPVRWEATLPGNHYAVIRHPDLPEQLLRLTATRRHDQA